MSRSRVVIVGASMAGLRAAESLQRTGFEGEIVLVGEERSRAYNRPPLSKTGLTDVDFTESSIALPSTSRSGVRWQLGAAAVSCSIDDRQTTLETGEVIEWDGLVVATGVRPRRLEIPGPTAGRFVLRTVDDLSALRSVLASGSKLAIIGAGFIGCEVASAARKRHLAVDVIAPEPVPMLRTIGRTLGRELQRRHEAAGARFHLGTSPVRFDGDSEVRGVELSDGADLRADLVLEAVGSRPNTEWLAGNGLDLSDGVLTDEYLRVVGAEAVVACGDVARTPDSWSGMAKRVEHWTAAIESARYAGRTLAAELTGAPPGPRPFEAVHSFWTDQCDVRIQTFGQVGGNLEEELMEGHPENECVVGFKKAGMLVGVALLEMSGRRAFYKAAIDEARISALTS